MKFVYFLVVNNNKYLSHVVDNIIFGISVPDYPSRTVEITFLGQFQLTFQMSECTQNRTNKQNTHNNRVLILRYRFRVKKTTKSIQCYQAYHSMLHSLIYIRPLLVGNLFQLHRPHQIWLPHEYCHY